MVARVRIILQLWGGIGLSAAAAAGGNRGLERDPSSQIEVGNPGNGGKGVCILIISNGTPWYTPEADNEGCTKVSMFVVMVLDGFSLSKASVN